MRPDEMQAFRRMLRHSARPREHQVFPWNKNESVLLARAATQPDHIDALVIEHADWLERVERACEDAGVTPEELWHCSLDDDFPTPDARKLWLAIGGLCCVPDERQP
jgi:hypothetical protein